MSKRLLPENLQALLRQGKKFKRSKGQVIQSTADQRNFNLLIRGYVKRYLISNDGTLGVEVIYGSGDVFPVTLIYKTIFKQEMSVSPEVFYYEAMTDVTIYSLDIDKLVEAVAASPMLYRELFLECGKRLHSTLHSLENLTLKTSYNRVAHQIFYFATRFGEKRLGSSIRIDLPLTHQDIADVLSLTRETVSMSMVELKKKGLILPGRHIVVPSLKKLQAEAYS